MLVVGSIQQAIAEAKQLAQFIDDDATPYKSKYEAADKLQAAEVLQHVEIQDANQRREVIAMLKAHRSLILMETDLAAEGQQEAELALDTLRKLPTPVTLERATLLHALESGLGQLWSSREQASKATPYLESAQQLYKDTQATWHAGGSIPVGELTGQTEEELRAELNEQHTQTLLCMAYICNIDGQRERAAVCCAETLGRQLESGTYQPSDWVQNTLQLSGFFIDTNAFALAETCVLAAKAVAAAAAGRGETVDEDVATNILIGEGKLYGSRLKASHLVHVEGQQLQYSYPTPASFSASVRFPSLDLPPLDTLPWGQDALVCDFEGARQLFNKSQPLLKKALQFYSVDDWVSEHVPLLMYISNLYRMLASFDPDPHRKCVMHRQRAKLLEGPLEELNPSIYPHLARGLAMELGNINRTIYEIKEREGRPDGKVATAAATAAAYYERVIRSFEPNAGRSKSKRIEPEEDEVIWVNACFNAMRSLRAAEGSTRRAPPLPWALQCADNAVAYVAQHQLQSQFPEAPLVHELAQLMRSKADMAGVQAKAGVNGA